MTSGNRRDFSNVRILEILHKKIVNLKFCEYFKRHKIERVIESLVKHVLKKLKSLYDHIDIRKLERKIKHLIKKVLHSKLFKQLIENFEKNKRIFLKYLKTMFTKDKLHCILDIIKLHATPEVISKLKDLTLDILKMPDFGFSSLMTLYTKNASLFTNHLKYIIEYEPVKRLIKLTKKLKLMDYVKHVLQDKTSLEIIKIVMGKIMVIMKKPHVSKSSSSSRSSRSSISSRSVKPVVNKVVPVVKKVVPVVKKVVRHHKKNPLQELFGGKTTGLKMRM